MPLGAVAVFILLMGFAFVVLRLILSRPASDPAIVEDPPPRLSPDFGPWGRRR